LNGCTAAKVSWRSSTDGYSSVNFPHGGLANQCEVSYLRTFHQENTNTIHLVYHLSDSGSCTVTSSDNTEHLKENGGSWSSIRFGTRHFGASQLGVTGAGVVYLFTRSTWSNPCSTWSLVYQSSAD